MYLHTEFRRYLRELTLSVKTELQKIANWFCANKMAINASKTKFIKFRTRGKIVNPLDCKLIYNGNEIGMPENPKHFHIIKRIQTRAKQRISNYLAFCLTNIFLSMTIYHTCVQKYLNLYSALTG
jgi:hypothetical protein